MAAEAGAHDVFISYRSSRSPDREIAEQLQKTLEAYPIPLSLRKALARPARFAWLPSRLRVFRDSSDLSATPDLWHAIRHELLRSRWLVVVCSPGTSQSPWIAKEIDTFLEMNGRERVIAVLVEGEPDDSIPPQLRCEAMEVAQGDSSRTSLTRPVAPRASDLRARDVRSAVALLKGWRTPRTRQKRFDVLAPILGLSSREDLVQRHRARVRQRLGFAVSGVILIAVVGAYLQNRAAVADARSELSLAQAREAEAQSRVAVQDKRLAEAEAASSKEKEKLERESKIVETAMRRLSQAYRHQFADPFTAAAEVYASTQSRTLEDSEPAMDAVHAVLLERRAIAIRERTITPHGAFSFVSQSTVGERYTTLSRDGSKVLVITGRKGDEFSPELPGEAYVLDNRTLQLAPLNSCGTHPYRLEFAAFLGQDKALVARAFHVDIYAVTGKCLGSFQLRATKTPVTAAGGMLHDVFFIAGNGAGCVWVQEYGRPGLVEPTKELGAVRNCDEKNHPDALTQVLANSRGDRGILMFLSGRIDVFGFDGSDGRPKRRSIVKRGGRAVAFEMGDEGSNFAVSHGDGRSQKLELWNAAGDKPARVGSFSLAGVDQPVDFLGFSSDGRLLIGIDTSCALHYWEREKRSHLLTRPARQLPCLQPNSSGG